MYTLYNQEYKPLAKGHTAKTLKHQAKRHQSQYLYITDSKDVKILERNAGTWRRL